MRKTLRALTAALAAVFVLSACGAKTAGPAAPVSVSDANDIVGKWKLESVLGTKAGETESAALDLEENASKFAEVSGVYTFNDDGTGNYTSEEGGGTFEYSGTWAAPVL